MGAHEAVLRRDPEIIAGPELARASESGRTDPVLLKSPLLFYIRLYARTFWIGMAFLLVTNILDGLYPLLIKRALDQVAEGAAASEVMKTAFAFFLLMAGLAGTRYGWRTFFGTYHTNAAEDIRRRLFRHLSQLDPNFFSRHQIGDLMSHLVNDVQAFRAAIGNSVLILVDGAVIIVVILPLMIMLNPGWTWKTLVFLPAVPFLIKWVTRVIFDRYKIEQEKLSGLSGFTQETVSGIRVLKSFVQENTRLRMYRELNLDYEKSCNRVAIFDSLFGPIMEFGVAAGSVILIFVAAPDLLSGAASVGTFVAFQRYINKMVWPMTAFGLGFSQYQKGMASFSRIRAILETPTAVPDSGDRELGRFESLEARGLAYAYPHQGEALLQDISFTIRAGERVGIVGVIGSGKSTLAQLLTRILPAEPGTVRVNGLPIEEFRLGDLRSRLLLVPQEPLLFSMSVEDNLRLPRPEATRPEIREWLEKVQILEEIESLPFGLSTELGERGVNLSGGQKQRLALARGFLMRPDLLVLDDVMSAVDPRTEERLIQSLDKWNQTLILISHRLSVLRTCDRLLVLNRGRLEAEGSWSEVYERSPVFRQMCDLQEVRP